MVLSNQQEPRSHPHPIQPGSHVPPAPSAEPFEGHDFDGADTSGGDRVYHRFFHVREI